MPQPHPHLTRRLSADFLDAHFRHWEDAELLRDNGRLANADQLYGLSAECGLKAIMQRLGMRTTPEGKPENPDFQVHIDRLWNVFRGFASGKKAVRMASRLSGGNPFQDWLIDHRYANRSHFTPDTIRQHKKGAAQVRSLVMEARLSGILR